MGFEDSDSILHRQCACILIKVLRPQLVLMKVRRPLRIMQRPLQKQDSQMECMKQQQEPEKVDASPQLMQQLLQKALSRMEHLMPAGCLGAQGAKADDSAARAAGISRSMQTATKQLKQA